MKKANIFIFIIIFIFQSYLIYSKTDELIKRTIFITPVQYESNYKEYDYLKEIIRDVLITKLSSTRNFSFLNFKEGDNKLEYFQYNSSDLNNPAKLSDFCIKSGSDIIINVKYSKIGKTIKIEIKIFNLLTGDFTKTYTINNSIGLEIIDKIDNLGIVITKHMSQNYNKIEEKTLSEKIIEKYGNEKYRIFNKHKNKFIGKGKFEITFKENINTKYEVIAIRGKEVYIFNKYDNIFLEKGQWLIIIKSESFENASIKINVSNNNRIIDFTPDYYMGTVIFNNLKHESCIYLNGENVTRLIKDSKLTIKTGFYYVRILTDNYNDYIDEIRINKDEIKEINVDYGGSNNFSFNSNNTNRKTNPGVGFFISGTSLLIIGIGFIGGGFGGYGFEEYQYSVWSGTGNTMLSNIKYAFLAIGIVGCISAVTGITFLFVSIPFFVKNRKRKVSLNFNFGNNNDFYISYCF